MRDGMSGRGAYYGRRTGVGSDGTPVFASAEDDRNEREVADLVEQAFGCELRRFGLLSPIDWFAVRHERVVALVELKSRTHSSDQFPDVWLNVRKWLSLLLGSHGLAAPGFFVVRFTNEVRWVNIAAIPIGIIHVRGTSKIVKGVSDIEPVIAVPVQSMNVLRPGVRPESD